MKKMYLDIIKILLISGVMLIFICTSLSYAENMDVSSTADDFIKAGENATSTGEDKAAMNSAINDIAGLLTGLGVIVAVVVAAILGIKFMMGSIEEQAKIKEFIIPYIVGCVVVFGAVGIWRIVVEALNTTMPK